MITDEEVMRLFERADPARVEDTAPDVDATGYLATLRTRSSNVTLIDTEPTRTGPNTGHRRLLVIVAAAAAVVAIVVGAFVVAGRGDPAEPQIPAGTTAVPLSPEAAAAVQVAREFIEARDTWDGDRLLALLADDAVVDELAVAGADDYGANADFERIMKWRFQQPRCTATEGGPSTEVTCTYLMHNALTTALDVGPFTGSSFEFAIADGRIQQVTHHVDFSESSPAAFDVFRIWLDDTRPDDVDAMFDAAPGGIDVANHTPEALGLFEQRVPEFEAVRTALRYVEARVAWDGATAGSLVADDARIVDGRYVPDGIDDVHLATAEYDRITGWQFRDPQCSARTLSEPQVRVRCRFTMANAASEALGVGPYDGSWFEFLVAGGEIQEVIHNFDYGRYSSQVFEAFTRWLDEAHPGDLEVLFEFADGTAVGRLTPDSLALWEQRIPEFVSSLSDS